MKNNKLKVKSSKHKASILVSGSLVYDTIFNLNGKIKEQINLKKGILQKQNLMFTAKEKNVFFGGTGGNICYGLSLLGISPLLFSVVGKDFGFYEDHLKNLGVNIKVKKDEKGFSSTFYAMIDDNCEQIGIFQSGVYQKNIEKISLTSTISKKELYATSVAIFSPGTAKSILKEILELKKVNKKALIIFDPGQMLSIDFTKDILEKCLKKSNLLILNDSELNILKTKFSLSLEDVFNFGIENIIETRAKKGSVLYTKTKEGFETFESKPIKAKMVVDPTGAGDAFRAGLISEIVKGKSLKESLKLASKLGSRCVENFGGQTYKI